MSDGGLTDLDRRVRALEELEQRAREVLSHVGAVRNCNGDVVGYRAGARQASPLEALVLDLIIHLRTTSGAREEALEERLRMALTRAQEAERQRDEYRNMWECLKSQWSTLAVEAKTAEANLDALRVQLADAHEDLNDARTQLESYAEAVREQLGARGVPGLAMTSATSVVPAPAAGSVDAEEPYCDVCGQSGKDLRTDVEVCRDCYERERTNSWRAWDIEVRWLESLCNALMSAGLAESRRLRAALRAIVGEVDADV